MTEEEFKQVKKGDRILYRGAVFKVTHTNQNSLCFDIVISHKNENFVICSCITPHLIPELTNLDG